MDLDLLGDWGEPLSPSKYDGLIRQAVERSAGCCAYCKVQMPVTGTSRYAGLHACPYPRGAAPELPNLVTLCSFCVHLNSLDNLKNKGVFVELPWLSQSELINILRIVYCVQKSDNPTLRNTGVYKASSALVEALARLPRKWEEHYFDGSVERVSEAVSAHKGFEDKENPEHVVYINRLRFFFHAEEFKDALQFWLPTIEAQIMNAESEEASI